MPVLVLSGGVGGAKMVWGLAQCVPGENLVVVVNTADDFEHLGLYISPDADTVLYTLAGRANHESGWGRADESWRVLDELDALGGPSWFRLGDLDLATHLYRRARLDEGATLTDVCAELSARWGVQSKILPMSDQVVRTMITARANDGSETCMKFQEYFVRHQCAPTLVSVAFDRSADARPNKILMQLLQKQQVSAVIIAPSNPIVSINPILCFPEVRHALCALKAPVVAVSPIVGGRAIKGPLAKMLSELGTTPSVGAVAEYYADFLDGFIIDEADTDQREQLAMPVRIAPTVMNTPEQKTHLAQIALEFCARLSAKKNQH